MLIDPTEEGGGAPGGGGGAEATAVYVNGEPTVYAFAEDVVDQATRLYYQAADSGIYFTLVVSSEAQRFAGATGSQVINTVARQWAAAWNENAQVPGVVEIDATAQDTTPLGFLTDVANVAVRSTSGKTGGVLTVTQAQSSPDVFAATVHDFRTQLDALEAG